MIGTLFERFFTAMRCLFDATVRIDRPRLLFRRWFGAGLATLLVLTVILASPVSVRAETDWRLFGTREFRSDKIAKFEKWTDTLRRYDREQPRELDTCRISPTNQCHIAKWRIFLNGIKDRPPAEQLDLVNDYLNKWLYVIDPVNYGVKDYWATPAQFMVRNGDCEDYAIAKYASLVHLGFPKDKMRILVLQDLNLQIGHAVLLVELDGKVMMLDNQISSVIEADRVKHYKPIYSINETAWWLHRG